MNIFPDGLKVIIGDKYATMNNYLPAVGKEGIIVGHSTRWFSLTGAREDGIEYCVEVPSAGRTWEIRKDDIIVGGNNNKQSKYLLERDY